MTWARDIFPNSCRFWRELERHQHLLAHLGFHMVPCYSIFHWIQANTDFAKSGSHSILEKPASCQSYCVPKDGVMYLTWIKNDQNIYIWTLCDTYIFEPRQNDVWVLYHPSSIFLKHHQLVVTSSHSRNAAQGRGIQCTRTALDFQNGFREIKNQ